MRAVIAADTARTLRGDACLWLRDQWPDAVIIPELSVASWGGARLDVAAVTTKEMIGVEIKGEGDSTARLALQGMQYGAVCTRLFLLPCASLRDKCVKARPPGWIMARNAKGEWWSKGGRRKSGFEVDSKRLPTSAIRLLEMLWADEVGQLCRLFDIDEKAYRGQRRLEHIEETVPLGKLRSAVFRRLYLRRWESGRMPKKVWRPDVLAA